MRKYLKYVEISIRRELRYKTNIIGLIITTWIVLITQIRLWGTIYSDVKLIEEINYASVFWYFIISMIVRKLLGGGIDDSISRSYVNGDIAIDLLRPQKYILKCISYDLGRGIVHSIIISIICCFFVFLENVSFTFLTSEMLVFILLSSVFSYILYSLLCYCIGLSSIWFGRSIGLSMIKQSLFNLLGGAFIPLDFYPKWILNIIDLLPFKYIYYTPCSIFMNQDNLAVSIMTQFGWCSAFTIIAYFITVKAKNKIEIQGG